ncbi:glycoside hydrolase family 27 protein [Streptomyces coffeae]|uniref:Glycoside hydrolase family 27 protein n=1 Tax=Streptomyces coffeae TaxID=621382 RepID=A0ABS1NPW1_9ACTN|nr:glycoside hydrolase family 27 protein [Streptomyces coffeae]MBL1102132.1 glycoside hydrolase family 27 protein [Streptomyces coffeae]
MSSTSCPPTTRGRHRRPRTAGVVTAALALCVAPVITSGPAAAATAPDSLSTLYAAAPTPTMGWNSWYGYGGFQFSGAHTVANITARNINSTKIRAEADALVSKGLKTAGYDTVWLDEGWWDGSRDGSGNITVNTTQWPGFTVGSTTYAAGMKGLADYIHSKGLKAGIYTDSGKTGCSGLPDGSAEHVQQDIDAFAAWGYDAVKIDHCGGDITGKDEAQTYAAYRHAILNNSSGRTMVFNVCRWQYGSYMPVTANTWRTDLDIASVNADGSSTRGDGNFTLAKVMRNLDTNGNTPSVAGPGHFNDPDYLLTGHDLDNVPTTSTDAISRSQFSMWAMMNAPLIIGTKASTLSAASVATLTNDEVIAIDQDSLGAQGVKVSEPSTGLQVWSKRLAAPGTRAIALFNRTGTAAHITVNFTDTGLTSTDAVTLRDSWGKTNLGSKTGSYTTSVPAYSTVMLKATGTESGSWTDIGGTQSASPAIASGGPDSADAFVRGTDGALYQKTWGGHSWTGAWANLGGPTGGTFTGTPAAVSDAPGQIDVAVRGTDNHLYHRAYRAGSWGSWEDLGGTIADSPAISSQHDNQLDVFVRGTDGALYQKSWDGTAWSSNWANLGGPSSGTFTGAPAAVSNGSGRIDLAVRGTDDAVYHRAYYAGSWHAWESLGGTITESPAITSASTNRWDVLVRGTDGALYRKHWNGIAWDSNWANLGGVTSGTFNGTPAAVSLGGNQLLLAVRGTDDHNYARMLTSS